MTPPLDTKICPETPGRPHILSPVRNRQGGPNHAAILRFITLQSDTTGDGRRGTSPGETSAARAHRHSTHDMTGIPKGTWENADGNAINCVHPIGKHRPRSHTGCNEPNQFPFSKKDPTAGTRNLEAVCYPTRTVYYLISASKMCRSGVHRSRWAFVRSSLTWFVPRRKPPAGAFRTRPRVSCRRPVPS